MTGLVPTWSQVRTSAALIEAYDFSITIYRNTPLQFCGLSISTDLFLCTFSLQNSSRQGDEGPWVWLTYRAERCLFSPHIFAPCFSTFVRRVHSQTFEGGIDAPRFLASEWFRGIRIDRVMSARDAGARYELACAAAMAIAPHRPNALARGTRTSISQCFIDQ